MKLIEFNDHGLFCPAGGFYIDPWKPVDKAIITHAHSDHARYGSADYLTHKRSVPIMKLRLGDIAVQGVEWNEALSINGVQVSLHPAGHIIGSSQVRVAYKGEVWVVSGDYKIENDGLSGAFEPVPCDTFITESTFGLPIYNWKPQAAIYAAMQQWVMDNMAEGKNSVFIAYSLGKAQRVIDAISEITNKIFVHGAVWNVQEAFLQNGEPLATVTKVVPEMDKKLFQQAVIIAPSGAENSPWMKKFAPYNLAVCSGWMQVRGNQRRRNADRAFALSDHADWNGLISAVEGTGAKKVYVTHGFQAVFSKYLNERGIEAEEVKTAYGNETDDPIGEKETAAAL